MGEAIHDGLAVPGQVVLAREPPFRIGQLAVDPPTRQIEHGEYRETLEPRVMQVLVVLARAGSAIVTRDDLVARCWDGRIVGDDAINRVISRIRHVAADIGDGSFSVQTIAKVGYRIVTAASERTRPSRPVQTDRRKLIFGSVAAATVAAVGSTVAWRGVNDELGPPRDATLLFDRADAIRSTGLPQDSRQAIAYLKEAIRIAPEYGEAWGALALAYSITLWSESPDRVEGFAEMRKEAIRQAGIHDPGNADAAAAQLPGSYYGRWAQAEQVYRDLIRRHPAHPTAYHHYGTLLMDVGRWDDAVDVLEAAKARNSLSPPIRYKRTVSLWSAGRISEAEAEIDDALKQWPQHGAIWQTKVKLLALTGRPVMALALVNDPGARPIEEKGEPLERRRLTLTALVSGERGDVARVMNAMLVAVRSGHENGLTVAPYCALLGHSGLALDIIEGVLLGTGEWAALQPREAARMQTHPLFQPHARSLWANQRFAALVNHIGMERYWTATETAPDFRRSHQTAS